MDTALKRTLIPPTEHLIRYLAHLWSASDTFVYQHCTANEIMHYPAVSGTRHQNTIHRTAEMVFDRDVAENYLRMLAKGKKRLSASTKSTRPILYLVDTLCDVGDFFNGMCVRDRPLNDPLSIAPDFLPLLRAVLDQHVTSLNTSR